MWLNHENAYDAFDPSQGILLVETEPVIRKWLVKILDRTFSRSHIFIADSAERAIELLDENDIGVAVVDVQVGERAGLDIAREVIHRNSAACSILITVYGRDNCIVEAMKIHTLGYLAKEQPLAFLAEQLRMIMAGEQPGGSHAARRCIRHLLSEEEESSSGSCRGDTSSASLSAREQEVLSLIAKGLQVSHVAKALGITENTASSHIKNIYRKKQISSRAEAALEAKRLGLV